MAGIGVVLNPHSRSNKRNPDRIRKLGFFVGDKGSCHKTETLEEVTQLAREFKERQIEILGISGGDGTLHKTLSTFIEVYGDTALPQIAFLRGGTMNNVAGILGIKGTPENILSNLIVKYHEGKEFRIAPLNMIKVNNSYGFLFGMGIVTRFLSQFEAMTKGDTRPAWAALLLAKHMVGSLFNTKAARGLAAPIDTKITVDGEVLAFKNYSMLFAGTIESLCFNFRPLWLARTLEQQFHLMGISGTPRQVLSHFPRAWFMKPIRSPSVTDRVGARASFEFPTPQQYTLDGDFPEGPVTRIEMTMGPRLTCIIS